MCMRFVHTAEIRRDSESFKIVFSGFLHLPDSFLSSFLATILFRFSLPQTLSLLLFTSLASFERRKEKI